MADVEVRIAGRRYDLACRDGEEPHLRSIAAMVDAKASDALKAMGGLSEAKTLLLAALLLADELHDARAALATPAPEPPAPPPVETDPALTIALERLAQRMEALAARD